MTQSLQFSRGFQIKRDSVTETGTFSGYASTFNGIDAGGDRIAPGAYAASLRDWKKLGKLPPMLLQHGGFIGPAEDGIPIGIWDEMLEDAKGLKVSGRLFALDTDKGRYIHEGLKSGALDGLSIGYVPRQVLNGTGKPGEPRRTLQIVELREVSVVTFPMDRSARIDAAKAANSPRELEAALKQIGFSGLEAKRIVSGGWAALKNQPNTSSQAAALLRARTAALTQGLKK